MFAEFFRAEQRSRDAAGKHHSFLAWKCKLSRARAEVQTRWASIKNHQLRFRCGWFKSVLASET